MITKHEIQVDCCRLFGGSVSVRIDEEEVAILPPKISVDALELERLLVKVVEKVTEQLYEDLDHEDMVLERKDW